MVLTGIGSYDGCIVGFRVAGFDQTLEHDFHQLIQDVWLTFDSVLCDEVLIAFTYYSEDPYKIFT